jgi:hypothetical protein
MREKGLLDILTMDEYARRLEKEKKKETAQETVLAC